MQGVMETLLLIDRLTFLRERGLSPILLPLFDDLVSPRNIAIVTTLPGKTFCELYNTTVIYTDIVVYCMTL